MPSQHCTPTEPAWNTQDMCMNNSERSLMINSDQNVKQYQLDYINNLWNSLPLLLHLHWWRGRIPHGCLRCCKRFPVASCPRQAAHPLPLPQRNYPRSAPAEGRLDGLSARTWLRHWRHCALLSAAESPLRWCHQGGGVQRMLGGEVRVTLTPGDAEVVPRMQGCEKRTTLPPGDAAYRGPPGACACTTLWSRFRCYPCLFLFTRLDRKYLQWKYIIKSLKVDTKWTER